MRPPSPEAREAILAQLYSARAELNRARRLDTATYDDLETLVDLNAYIDDLESVEANAEAANVWSKLENVARAVLELQASVERAK